MARGGARKAGGRAGRHLVRSRSRYHAPRLGRHAPGGVGLDGRCGEKVFTPAEEGEEGRGESSMCYRGAGCAQLSKEGMACGYR